MSDIELISLRVAENRQAHRKRQKERYELAKKLGFSPKEAVILQNWSLERILALTESKRRL